MSKQCHLVDRRGRKLVNGHKWKFGPVVNFWPHFPLSGPPLTLMSKYEYLLPSRRYQTQTQTNKPKHT